MLDRRKSINNISYADDMVLLSPSIRGLRKLVKICEGYAEKSEVMISRAGNK